MVAIYPLLSLFVVFAVSLFVVRVGSVGLRMTGLTPEVASFQAASAFSGAGFTTQESEHAVSTPERRTIVKALIRLGSVGLVSVIASLVLSFTNANGDNLRSLLLLSTGVVAIVLVARSDWLNRALTPLIRWGLEHATDLDVKDYTEMLGLQRDYRVAEVDVDEGGWLAHQTPADVDLSGEGVLLLGVRRDDTYLGAPGGDIEIRPDDTAVLYGKEDRLKELAGREAGDEAAHEDAVTDHETVLAEQERRIETEA